MITPLHDALELVKSRNYPCGSLVVFYNETRSVIDSTIYPHRDFTYALAASTLQGARYVGADAILFAKLTTIPPSIAPPDELPIVLRNLQADTPAEILEYALIDLSPSHG